MDNNQTYYDNLSPEELMKKEEESLEIRGIIDLLSKASDVNVYLAFEIISHFREINNSIFHNFAGKAYNRFHQKSLAQYHYKIADYMGDIEAKEMVKTLNNEISKRNTILNNFNNSIKSLNPSLATSRRLDFVEKHIDSDDECYFLVAIEVLKKMIADTRDENYTLIIAQFYYTKMCNIAEALAYLERPYMKNNNQAMERIREIREMQMTIRKQKDKMIAEYEKERQMGLKNSVKNDDKGNSGKSKTAEEFNVVNDLNIMGFALNTVEFSKTVFDTCDDRYRSMYDSFASPYVKNVSIMTCQGYVRKTAQYKDRLAKEREECLRLIADRKIARRNRIQLYITLILCAPTIFFLCVFAKNYNSFGLIIDYYEIGTAKTNAIVGFATFWLGLVMLSICTKVNKKKFGAVSSRMIAGCFLMIVLSLVLLLLTLFAIEA